MAPFRKFPKKRGVRKTTKTSKKRVSKTSNKQIATVCKRIIASNLENKILNYQFPNTNMLIYTNGSWATNQLIPLSPYSTFMNPINGTLQNQRIGNQITIKKASVKLQFYPNGYDATTNIIPTPVYIKVVVFYDKLLTTVLPTGVPGFYQNGSSSTDPTTSSSIDILKSYNKDRYVVKSTKTFKLGYSSYQAGAGGSITNQFSANNDFKLLQNYSLDYTKHLTKVVKYNDASLNPTTRGLFMAIFVTPAVSQVVAGNAIYSKFQGFMEIEYEDA